jgi:hypothetical protein
VAGYVIYGFQAHLKGRIILFFFEETAAGYQPIHWAIAPFPANEIQY